MNSIFQRKAGVLFYSHIFKKRQVFFFLLKRQQQLKNNSNSFCEQNRKLRKNFEIRHINIQPTIFYLKMHNIGQQILSTPWLSSLVKQKKKKSYIFYRFTIVRTDDWEIFPSEITMDDSIGVETLILCFRKKRIVPQSGCKAF